MKIAGDHLTHTVYVDGRKLSPRASLELRDHGGIFSWGYLPGSAQLALALALLIAEEPEALRCYTDLLNDVVTTWPSHEDINIEIDLSTWLSTWLRQGYQIVHVSSSLLKKDLP